MGKHGKYKKKYRKEWEKEGWARGWLREAEATENTNTLNEAFCKLCKTALRAHHGDLIKHINTKKHIQNQAKIVPSENQSTLDKFATIEITNDQKLQDMKLSTYVAVHTAIRSVDHLNDVIHDCGNINLKLHRTKCTGVIKNVISPSLLEELIEDLGDNKFSLIVDESTDKSTIKYLCICIKYFSTKENSIMTNYLCILKLENATANSLFECLCQFCEVHKINLKNLIGIGTDGANNLCGKNHSLFTLLKETIGHLQLVRCVCHSLNNASAKAAEELPAHIDFLSREIFNWFQYSSNRKINYKKTWDLINLNENRTFHEFVQLAPTRWLSRYNVIKTILEHWVELRTHFSHVEEKCYTARVSADMLNDDSNYSYLLILKAILYEINTLNLVFQKNNVDIGKAYKDLCSLIYVVAKKVMTANFANSNISVIHRNIDNDLAFLPYNQCDFGYEYYTYISSSSHNVSHDKRAVIEERMFKYFKSLLQQLCNRLPDSLNFFKGLQNISPQFTLSQSKPKFNELPFINIFIPTEEIHKVETQWNKIHTVEWSQFFDEETLKNSYKFWPKVLKFKDAAENQTFKELATFCLTCLSLPSSNAVVERAFSVMNAIKTKERNRLQIKMLDAILRVRLTLYSKNQCCKDFTATPSMIKRFNSKEIYTKETNVSDVDEVYEIFMLI